MASLKNLTVTAQAVKKKIDGIIEYMKYLNDPSHKNHKKKNTQILSILKDSNKNDVWANSFIHKVNDESLSLNMKNASNKGGRPVESFAVSFDFTVPKNTIRPTEEQWKAISRDIIQTIKKEIPGISNSHFYLNVHDQDNPHLNCMISKVVNGQRIRKVDQKAFLSKLKKVHSQSVLKHTGFDYKDYTPLETNLGRKQKQWQLIKNANDKTIEQFKNLAKYIQEENNKRINSTENRIVSTLSKIDYSDAERTLNAMEVKDDEDFNNSLNKIKTRLKNRPEF